MHIGLLALPALLSGQTVSPDVVDAKGQADVVFKVPANGMYRVRVQSDAGTACSIANHLRGPFAESGSVGTASCDTDLLLDAGLYKARLTSPQRGKGRAKLEVTAFQDAAPAVKLDDGAQLELRVRPREQVSAWMRIEKRQSVTLEIAGRTVGLVGLWRDGQWLEDVHARHMDTSPRAGRGIHRWRIDAALNPGDYKLVVYGAQVKQWSQGPEEDVAFVTRGAPPGGPARARRFTIPAWGFTELAVEQSALAAFVELDDPPKQPVTVGAEPVTADAALGRVRAKAPRTCTIEAGKAIPACAVSSSSGAGGAHVISIDGAPGTSGEIVWGPVGSAGAEGYWPSDSTAKDLRIVADGTYFITAPALPLSQDGEPLGCAIDEITEKGTLVRRVAVDAPVVDWTKPFERKFNYAATSTSVWLQIEKPGLYEVKGALGATCEIFKRDGWKRDRVGAGEDGKCAQTRALGAGLHEVRFYGGKPGVQSLRVAQVGLPGGDPTPPKAACSFENVALTRGLYRLETSSEGGAVMRALLARQTPSPLAVSVPVVIDPKRSVSIQIAAGAPMVAHTRPGMKLRCALGGVDIPVRAGACVSGPVASASTLVLASDEAAPIMAVVGRMDASASPPSPPRYDPTILRLPSLTQASPLWLDLDRDQSRSMLVSVEKPGLYDIATEGLLSTSCRLRTPTVGNLIEGAANGRGRNCLVQAYLKPGTYLFTARATGQSKGRAGVRLVQRAPRDLGAVSVGDELFFKVDAGELAQQTLDVRKKATLSVAASAQGAALSCRFDDHDGWPMIAVPASCAQSLELDVGKYILTSLPLTIESRRRTSLVKPVEAEVLEGDKLHVLALNRPYQAQLGVDGKDAFGFTLAADVDVGIALDHRMQGRISRVNDKGVREIVDTVPPVGGTGLAIASPEDEGEGGEGSEGGEGGEEYGENEGDPDEGSEGGEDAEYGRQRREEKSAAAAAAMARVTQPQEVGPLAGHVVHLTAGSYELEAEHSRGDVAIRYGVAVNVRMLAPGVVLQAPVPGRVDVEMPRTSAGRAGLLRIKTRGDIDVRCRLRDASGALVAESADSGADWNCALAVPLGAGRYSLTVEAEALAPGTTELAAEYLEAKETGELKDGDSFKVKAKVASAPLPSAGPDVVHDVLLTSDQDFSCAVQDDKGALLDRRTGTRACRFLLWPGEEKEGFRVFAWTPDRPASIKVALKRRRVKDTSGGKLDDDVVGRAKVDQTGRFATGPGALCRQAGRGGGVLSPCPSAASFVPGDVLVAVPGGGRVDLSEITATLATTMSSEQRVLDESRAAQRQRAKEKAVHLAQVAVPFGSSASPSCAIEGGVASSESALCSAASGPLDDASFSTLTTWTRSGTTVVSTIARSAAAWPDKSSSMLPGVATVTWSGRSARWSLPADGFRLRLGLPSDAWAVLLDDAGRPRDLCAPRRAPSTERKGAMSTCVLRGRGGELFVALPVSTAVSAASGQMRADLLALSTVEAPSALSGLRETKPSAPGRERIVVSGAPQERVVRVEGRGALACAIHLENGAHVAGCRATLPPGQAAEIRVEHDDLPWRIFTYAPGTGLGAFAGGRFGALPPAAGDAGKPSGGALAFGTAVGLGGNVVDKRLELASASAVRVRATAGVCGIATRAGGAGWNIVDAQGLGGGCDIVRVLPAGTHRVVVRGFGTSPLPAGNLSVSAEPVLVLDEGIGPETLVQAGDARTFRFTLASDGEVGVGMQVDADALSCALLDERQEPVGDGCHQFHRLRGGTYYLRVSAPDDGPPRRFKPVVFGLKGGSVDVPDEWLREFFARIGRKTASEVRR